MALIYLDSFQYRDTTNLRKSWNGDPAINTGIYRTGDRSMYSFVGMDDRKKFLFSGYINSVYIGVSFYANSVGFSPYSGGGIIGVGRDSYGVQCMVTADEEGRAEIRRLGTLLAESDPNKILGYTWHYIEAYFYVHDTAGEVKVWVDDELVTEVSGVDTKNQSASGIDSVYLNSPNTTSGGWNAFFNDLYVDSDTRHGPCRVMGYLPYDDGSHVDFTPSTGSDHWAMVDDAVADNDSTYNKGDFVGEKDTYKVLTGPLDAVYGLQIRSTVIKDGELVPARFKHLITQGGDHQGSTLHDCAGSYAIHTDVWDTDPSDSNPWNQTKIESAEFGLEVIQLGTTTTTTV